MKYYVAIMQNDTTQVIHDHNDYSSALSEFHSELAYRGEGRTKTACAILDHVGNCVRSECWRLEDNPDA